MAKCKNIERKKRRICFGDLDKRIILQNRALFAPVFNSVDFDETFTTAKEVWASIVTKSGKTYFDGVSEERLITHDIIIRYNAIVTAETWILYDGRRIDILDVEDLDEQKLFMKLLCNDHGLSINEATKA